MAETVPSPILEDVHAIGETAMMSLRLPTEEEGVAWDKLDIDISEIQKPAAAEETTTSALTVSQLCESLAWEEPKDIPKSDEPQKKQAVEESLVKPSEIPTAEEPIFWERLQDDTKSVPTTEKVEESTPDKITVIALQSEESVPWENLGLKKEDLSKPEKPEEILSESLSLPQLAESLTWEETEEISRPLKPGKEEAVSETLISPSAIPAAEETVSWEKLEESEKPIVKMEKLAKKVPEKMSVVALQQEEAVSWEKLGFQDESQTKPGRPEELISEKCIALPLQKEESVAWEKLGISEEAIQWEKQADKKEVFHELSLPDLAESLAWEDTDEIVPETHETRALIQDVMLECIEVPAADEQIQWEKMEDETVPSMEKHDRVEVTVKPETVTEERTTVTTTTTVTETVDVETTAEKLTREIMIEAVKEAEQKAPIFLSELRDVEVYHGEVATLECQVQGTPRPEITWMREGEFVTGPRYTSICELDGTCMLIISNVQLDDDAEYECVAQNPAGRVTSFAEVIVKELDVEMPEVEEPTQKEEFTVAMDILQPPTFITPITSQDADEGEPISFTALVNGSPEITITWYQNGEEIKESTDFRMTFEDNIATLKLCDVYIDDSGEYTCKAVNPVGVATCTATLTVLDQMDEADDSSSITREDTLYEQRTFVKKSRTVTTVERLKLSDSCESFEVHVTESEPNTELYGIERCVNFRNSPGREASDLPREGTDRVFQVMMHRSPNVTDTQVTLDDLEEESPIDERIQKMHIQYEPGELLTDETFEISMDNLDAIDIPVAHSLNDDEVEINCAINEEVVEPLIRPEFIVFDDLYTLTELDETTSSKDEESLECSDSPIIDDETKSSISLPRLILTSEEIIEVDQVEPNFRKVHIEYDNDNGGSPASKADGISLADVPVLSDDENQKFELEYSRPSRVTEDPFRKNVIDYDNVIRDIHDHTIPLESTTVTIQTKVKERHPDKIDILIEIPQEKVEKSTGRETEFTNKIHINYDDEEKGKVPQEYHVTKEDVPRLSEISNIAVKKSYPVSPELIEPIIRDEHISYDGNDDNLRPLQSTTVVIESAGKEKPSSEVEVIFEYPKGEEKERISKYDENAPVPKQASIPMKRLEPPTFCPPISVIKVEEGESAMFECIVKGHPCPMVEWFHNDDIVTNSYDFKLQQQGEKCTFCIREVFTDDAGEYSCRAVNLAGVATCTAELLVEELESESQRSSSSTSDGAEYIPSDGKVQPVTDELDPEKLDFQTEIYESKTVTRRDMTHVIEEILFESDEEVMTIQRVRDDTDETELQEAIIKPHSKEIEHPFYITKSTTNHDTQFYTQTTKDEINSESDSSKLDPFEMTLSFELHDHDDNGDDTDLSSIGAEYPRGIAVELDLIDSPKRLRTSSIKSQSSVEMRKSIEASLPRFIETPDDFEAVFGSTVILTCKADGVPTPMLTWFKDGRFLQPDDNVYIVDKLDGTGKLIIKHFGNKDIGHYKVEASNCVGKTTYGADITVVLKEFESAEESIHEVTTISEKVTTTVTSTSEVVPQKTETVSQEFQIETPLQDIEFTLDMDKYEPPNVTKVFESQSVLDGERVTFECTVTGKPLPEVTWLLNNKPIEHGPDYKIRRANDGTCTLELPEVFPEDADLDELDHILDDFDTAYTPTEPDDSVTEVSITELELDQPPCLPREIDVGDIRMSIEVPRPDTEISSAGLKPERPSLLPEEILVCSESDEATRDSIDMGMIEYEISEPGVADETLTEISSTEMEIESSPQLPEEFEIQLNIDELYGPISEVSIDGLNLQKTVVPSVPSEDERESSQIEVLVDSVLQQPEEVEFHLDIPRPKDEPTFAVQQKVTLPEDIKETDISQVKKPFEARFEVSLEKTSHEMTTVDIDESPGLTEEVTLKLQIDDTLLQQSAEEPKVVTPVIEEIDDVTEYPSLQLQFDTKMTTPIVEEIYDEFVEPQVDDIITMATPMITEVMEMEDITLHLEVGEKEKPTPVVTDVSRIQMSQPSEIEIPSHEVSTTEIDIEDDSRLPEDITLHLQVGEKEKPTPVVTDVSSIQMSQPSEIEIPSHEVSTKEIDIEDDSRLPEDITLHLQVDEKEKPTPMVTDVSRIQISQPSEIEIPSHEVSTTEIDIADDSRLPEDITLHLQVGEKEKPTPMVTDVSRIQMSQPSEIEIPSHEVSATEIDIEGDSKVPDDITLHLDDKEKASPVVVDLFEQVVKPHDDVITLTTPVTSEVMEIDRPVQISPPSEFVIPSPDISTADIDIEGPEQLPEEVTLKLRVCDDTEEVKDIDKKEVTLLPPSFVRPLKSTTVEDGQPLKMVCEVEGMPTPEITWFRDGENLLELPEFSTTFDNGICTVTLEEVFPEDAGEFECRATNPAGMTSTLATLTIQEVTSDKEVIEKETITKEEVTVTKMTIEEKPDTVKKTIHMKQPETIQEEIVEIITSPTGVETIVKTIKTTVIEPKTQEVVFEKELQVTEEKEQEEKKEISLAYVAIGNYLAETDEVMSLREGEELTVIERNHGDWWLVRRPNGEEGWVPGSYLETLETYEQHLKDQLAESMAALPEGEGMTIGMGDKLTTDEPFDGDLVPPHFIDLLNTTRAKDGKPVTLKCRVEGNPKPL
ncbi:uncharacterized protein LOC102801843 [Saccoglossus kowalevskii]